MNRTELLENVTIALSDRGSAYGDASENFQRIADMWGIILRENVTVKEVALCMAAVKVARLVETPDHADSWIDLAGYAALGVEVHDR
jgi:hypothetical protein